MNHLKRLLTIALSLLLLAKLAFAEECVLDIAYDYEPPALYYNDKNEMMRCVLTAKIIKALNELKDSSEYKAIINNYFN